MASNRHAVTVTWKRYWWPHMQGPKRVDHLTCRLPGAMEIWHLSLFKWTQTICISCLSLTCAKSKAESSSLNALSSKYLPFLVNTASQQSHTHTQLVVKEAAKRQHCHQKHRPLWLQSTELGSHTEGGNTAKQNVTGENDSHVIAKNNNITKINVKQIYFLMLILSLLYTV